jgi:hypothetical protein
MPVNARRVLPVVVAVIAIVSGAVGFAAYESHIVSITARVEQEYEPELIMEATPTPEATGSLEPDETPTPEPTGSPEPSGTPTPEPTESPETSGTPTPEPTEPAGGATQSPTDGQSGLSGIMIR